MTSLEIYLSVVCIFLCIGSFGISLWYRDLLRKFDDKVIQLDDMQLHIHQLTESLDIARNLNRDLNREIEKKSKLSGDVLAVLADMKAGGAVLEVTRVDRNDIFFHNGSQYR